MGPLEQTVLIAAILILLAVVSSKLSARWGVPGLVVFLGLGMLAGEDGIGRIQFDDLEAAHAVGTLALAAILFDGGLQTRAQALLDVWKPAFLMATVGVLVTSVVTGVVAAHVLGLSMLEGLLLGSIVGSTDAAAVFGVLRSVGVRLKDRLTNVLEVESGSNDPMAIFLTVGLIEVLRGEADLGLDLVWLFVQQFGVGIAVGWLAGEGGLRLINRINLASAGLYPVLTAACGLLSFGLAATLGGSGFLAVYLTGIVLGNSHMVFKRGTFLFHDGMAWIGQISMFVLLGLLSTPSALGGVMGEALLIAAVLILVARPLAVAPLMAPFRMNARETILVSWVGLKGAVPIILALFPLLHGLAVGDLLFDVIFFVVLVSALTQGWSIPWVARKLGLGRAPKPEPPATLEITSLRDVDADIVEYRIDEGSLAEGRRLNQLALPEGVVVALIGREGHLIPPRGSTRLATGDHVFVVLRGETRDMVDRVFGRDGVPAEPLPPGRWMRFKGSTRVGELCELYGIAVDAPMAFTLDDLMRQRLGVEPAPGDEIGMDGLRVRVVETSEGRLTTAAVTRADAAATAEDGGKLEPMPIRGILVPLDGSEAAEHALPHAASIARRSGARIALVHAMPETGTAEPADAYGPGNDGREKALAYLQEARRRLAEVVDVTVTTTVIHGRPEDRLVEHIEGTDVDLVVVTAHGWGPLSAAWLGGVAEHVVRTSPTPVLLVRPGEGGARLDEERAFHRILVPLDGSSFAEGVLGSATAMGRLMGAEYRLLQVVRPALHRGAADDVKRQEAAKRYLARVWERLAQEPALWHTKVVVDVDAASTILRHAEEVGADLIALTTRGRSGLARLFLGSVADKVVRGAGVPVLVQRPAVE